MSLRRRRHSTPVTVAVTPTTATKGVAATQQFAATLTNIHGASAGVTAGTWSSSNTAHATVSAAGLATAVNIGTPDINFTTEFPQVTDATPAVLTVIVGAAAKLAMKTQPSTTATSTVAFATQPEVRLRDASNNNVLSAGVNVVAAKKTGTGALSGTTTVATDANGVAVFTDLVLTGAGAHTLEFTSAGLTAVVSGTITVS